jgi:hypothetical protein
MLGSGQTKRSELGEEQSQEHIFFGFKVFVHKEFVLADQIVNSAYYCDILR